MVEHGDSSFLHLVKKAGGVARASCPSRGAGP
jgi:hypothetical protein